MSPACHLQLIFRTSIPLILFHLSLRLKKVKSPVRVILLLRMIRKPFKHKKVLRRFGVEYNTNTQKMWVWTRLPVCSQGPGNLVRRIKKEFQAKAAKGIDIPLTTSASLVNNEQAVRLSDVLRPVKPCPGVPGIHLNADRTVSMTAALLCGAGASPVHKDRGGSADHDQSENHAHAQRHAWEMLLWLKNGAHGRRARLA